MVDQKKSAQAKQQLRNHDGTYANEGKSSGMPTGDILNRFAQHSQSITGGAPVETYEQGEKRMRELDQKLIDIARKEYEERKFGPDDEGYRVESGLYVSREEFEKLPELDRNRYIAWGNDCMDGNEEDWNDPEQMAELANESTDDDDAEVYLTNPELTYTDDMDYSFGEYLQSKGCNPQSAEEGANLALQGHPDLEVTGDRHQQQQSPRETLLSRWKQRVARHLLRRSRRREQNRHRLPEKRYGQRLLRSDQHRTRSIQDRIRLG